MEETLLEYGRYAVANASNLVGFGLPLIVEVLNKDVVGTRDKRIVTVLVCVIAAGLLNWSKVLYGSPEQVIVSMGLILAESQVVFKLYFEKSALRGKIQEEIGSRSVVE